METAATGVEAVRGIDTQKGACFYAEALSPPPPPPPGGHLSRAQGLRRGTQRAGGFNNNNRLTIDLTGSNH